MQQTTLDNYLGIKGSMEQKLPENKTRVRLSYPQDWIAYNQTQTQEKSLFLELLHELTSQISQPKRQGAGRPSANLGEMIFY